MSTDADANRNQGDVIVKDSIVITSHTDVLMSNDDVLFNQDDVVESLYSDMISRVLR